jgi:hypothetical protein
MVERRDGTLIGVSNIKRRRLGLPISCHGGLNVGDCVPFYFCSRSIMLYVIHCANHPELSYTGGQGPIVHLEADLYRVVRWAEKYGRRWAFSLSNAGAVYTQFRAQLDQLGEINWAAVAAADFRPPDIPWHLVDRIGVHSLGIASKVAGAIQSAIQNAVHRPPIEVRRDWYY